MRHLNLTILITFVIVNVACISQKKVTNIPFEVSDASYFSWTVDENEKGTTVELILQNVAPKVQFDSIIFRKVMLPVRISENKNGGQTITAILPSGNSRLPIQTRHVDKPTQLIFHFNGERNVQLVKQIARKEMVYY